MHLHPAQAFVRWALVSIRGVATPLAAAPAVEHKDRARPAFVDRDRVVADPAVARLRGAVATVDGAPVHDHRVERVSRHSGASEIRYAAAGRGGARVLVLGRTARR